MTAAHSMRVMIVSANGYGRGHEALADALVEELGVVEPSADVVVVDGMESTFGSLNRRGTAAYARQIADDPAGYGRGYELSALPAPARALGRTIWLVATRALAAEAQTHRPDVVVSTHPFMTNALGRMRRHAQLAAPVLVPLHNLDPHPSWMSPGVDLHVANVPEDVPRIERNFRRAYQRAELRVATATPPVGLRHPGGGIRNRTAQGKSQWRQPSAVATSFWSPSAWVTIRTTRCGGRSSMSAVPAIRPPC
jgi:hypothetical protein